MDPWGSSDPSLRANNLKCIVYCVCPLQSIYSEIQKLGCQKPICSFSLTVSISFSPVCRCGVPLPARVQPLCLHLCGGPAGMPEHRCHHGQSRTAPDSLRGRVPPVRRRLAYRPDRQVKDRIQQNTFCVCVNFLNFSC